MGILKSDHENGEKKEEKRTRSDVEVDGQEASSESGGASSARYRWVCWKLEERGFVGETALHICFLLTTPTHMILAKKLLAMFPMLINDIYTYDEYFGESSLVSVDGQSRKKLSKKKTICKV